MQEIAIECIVRKLELPTHRVYYENLIDNFGHSMSAVLGHLGVNASALDAIALNMQSAGLPAEQSKQPSSVATATEGARARGETSQILKVGRSPSAPSPSPAMPCTPPGLDRYGVGSVGVCCDAECSEPRRKDDPAYHRYKVVVICRSACANKAHGGSQLSEHSGSMSVWRGENERKSEERGSGGSSSGTEKAAAVESFQKHTPSSLCEALSNLPELCEHFSRTRYRSFFEPYASNGCRCDTNAEKGEVEGPASHLHHSSLGIGGLDGARVLLVGTHHKTGTVLMGQVMRTAAHRLDQLVEGEGLPLLRKNWTECELHARRGELMRRMTSGSLGMARDGWLISCS